MTQRADSGNENPSVTQILPEAWLCRAKRPGRVVNSHGDESGGGGGDGAGGVRYCCWLWRGRPEGLPSCWMRHQRSLRPQQQSECCDKKCRHCLAGKHSSANTGEMTQAADGQWRAAHLLTQREWVPEAAEGQGRRAQEGGCPQADSSVCVQRCSRWPAKSRASVTAANPG